METATVPLGRGLRVEPGGSTDPGEPPALQPATSRYERDGEFPAIFEIWTYGRNVKRHITLLPPYLCTRPRVPKGANCGAFPFGGQASL